MNKYYIKAKKNLFNNGKCFTKGKIYTVESSRTINVEASLMEVTAINDLGEKHLIGSWWKNFELIKDK